MYVISLTNFNLFRSEQKQTMELVPVRVASCGDWLRLEMVPNEMDRKDHEKPGSGIIRYKFVNMNKLENTEHLSLKEALEFEKSVKNKSEEIGFTVEIIDHEPGSCQSIFDKNTRFAVKQTFSKSSKKVTRTKNFILLQGTCEELELKVKPYDIYEKVMNYAVGKVKIYRKSKVEKSKIEKSTLEKSKLK